MAEDQKPAGIDPIGDGAADKQQKRRDEGERRLRQTDHVGRRMKTVVTR